MKALIIKAEPAWTVEVREIEPTLETYQKLVGGYIQLIPLGNLCANAYLNEEGKMIGLPKNQMATSFCHDPAHDVGLHPHDVIVGDFVVVGPVDCNGNDTDCPQEIIDKLRAKARNFNECN